MKAGGVPWALAALVAALCVGGGRGRVYSDRATASSRVVLVHLHPSVDASVLQQAPISFDSSLGADNTTLMSREVRQQSRTRVYNMLSEFVRESQAAVSSFLRHSVRGESEGGQQVDSITPLWIQNALIVRLRRDHDETQQRDGADSGNASDDDDDDAVHRFFHETLRWLPGVVDVEYDRAMVRLLDTVGEDDEDSAIESLAEHSHPEQHVYMSDTPQKNIELLHAPALWAQQAKGKGIVIANIDSGVRYSHEALLNSFREYAPFAVGTLHDKRGGVNFDYSFWFTPGTDMAKETPDTADLVGHGTHTMGTIIGSKGIGMAPEATWITARAFDMFGAANKSDFLLAAQWVLCPTKLDGTGRDCAQGADVISNSFGIDRSSPGYKDWKWMSSIIQTWRAAGVYPVFASGNTNGFLCGSVYYPGSMEQTIAVGALIGGNSLWGASGKGPSIPDDTTMSGVIIKPDFVAPGVGVRSALSIKDNSYTRLTGTSMATPHVAGALALLLSMYDKTPIGSSSSTTSPPSMDKILGALRVSATKDLSKPFLVPSECGNTTYKQYPNNIYGWGMPNVCLAAVHLGFSCSESDSTDDKIARLNAMDRLVVDSIAEVQ